MVPVLDISAGGFSLACPSQIFISADLVDNYIGVCKTQPNMKTTIKLIRNILEKFNLIANLTAKNLALHQQLIVLNRSIIEITTKAKDHLHAYRLP